MSVPSIFSMHKVGKVVHPKREILKDISLSFFYGAKIGVVGLNGSGKSTLLRIMALQDRDILGEVVPSKDLRIGYLSQEPELDPEKTVRETVESGVGHVKDLLKRFEALSRRFGESLAEGELERLLEEQGELQTQIEHLGGWDLEKKLEIAADALRLPPWDAQIKQLSGGERRRVAVCKEILSDKDVLLLDEPTNHLDAESVAWLEQYLQHFPGTVVAVTHDRYFLDNVAGWILELDRGRGIPFQGNYSAWLEYKEKRLQTEERQEAAHKKAVAAELEWVRQSPKGRQAKSKARLLRYEEIASKEFQKRQETNEIFIPIAARLGDLVLEVETLSKSKGDRLLFEGLTFRVPKGAIVGIIGPNGAGKTTLFRLLTGQEAPDAGSIRYGETVSLAYVDQSRDQLDDQKTVWEEISGGQDVMMVGPFEMPSRAYVGRFNFKGSDQQKRVGLLSGGERNRVHLAKLLRRGGNLLLLDEPTNDLDVETLRALEEALLSFAGSALVISHDRWFLDRIATHILAFEGESRVYFHEGNYTDYEAYRKERLGQNASTPHRIRYRRIQTVGS